MRFPYILLLTSLALLAGAPSTRGDVALAHSRSPPVRSQPRSSLQSLQSIETALLDAAPTIRPQALHAALSAWNTLQSQGEVSRPLLTVIDYGLRSVEKRMWVFDLAECRLLFHELVAHGQNSGDDLARSFSNVEGSYMTSLGAFVTGSSYMGRNGYSMRLLGMEPGLNDRAEARAIVVHGAPYVREEFVRKVGRLGRSHGCPAVRSEIAKTLIDEVKDRTLLYAWHPSIDQAASAGVTVAPPR